MDLGYTVWMLFFFFFAEGGGSCALLLHFFFFFFCLGRRWWQPWVVADVTVFGWLENREDRERELMQN